MAKQPTYVWVVLEDASEAGGSKGNVAVYGRKADAVKHVRQMRRDWCCPATADDHGLYSGHEAILLKDWEVIDQPHVFAVWFHGHTVIEFEARRMEVL